MKSISAPLLRFLPVLICLACPVARAQGIITGSITGTVLDSTGAAIPGASVTAIAAATKISLTSRSTSTGVFFFNAIPIGAYSVTITAPGFQPRTVNNVNVVTGGVADLQRQQLSISANASVEVSADTANLISTTQAQINTTFDSEQLQDLPLNNGFDEVALLMPGTAQTHDDTFANYNGVGFSSNGQRGRSNNFELDGQSNNDNSVAGPQIFFGNQDAIAEIEVIQNNFSAQYGRNAGSVVNYITKSGTNTFHGSGFELYTGSFLSALENQQKSPLFGYCPPGVSPATGCTAPVVPRYVDNKYGGTLGGPVLRDKLFFFGSTYWEKTLTGATPSTSGTAYTPTPAGITELQTLFPNNPGVNAIAQFGPFAIAQGNPTPFNNGTPSEPIVGPTGATVNIPVAGVIRSIAEDYSDQEDLGRIDWQATPKDRFYLRYFYQTTNSTGVSVGSIAGGQFVNVPNTNHSVGADVTHTFSNAWLDQLRYSFQQSKLYFEGGAFPACTANNFSGCPSDLYFEGNDLDFGEVSSFPQGRTVKVTQVQNNATWLHGNNSILFGGEVDYQNSPNVYLPNYNGTFETGDLETLITQGSGSQMLLTNGSTTFPFTETDYALYFQDDYKLTRNLTLNLGMRWEFFGQAINELHKLTVAQQTGPNPFWSKALPLSSTTDPLTASAYKNFEPRFGFAWNPDAFHGRFVVRGGYAINFDPAFYNIFSNAATIAPVALSGTIACNGNCLGPTFTGAATRAANLSKLPLGGNPNTNDQAFVPTNFHNPYTENYTFGIEYQINRGAALVLNYAGNHQVGNFQSLDANPYLANVAAAYPKIVSPASLCTNASAPGLGRPNCNLSNYSLIANTAFAIYNAGEVQLKSAAYHGLTGQVSYTYSRTIDNTSEIFSTGTGGNTIALAQNPLNTDVGERNVSGISYPNVATISFNYALPFWRKQNTLTGKLLGGFMVGAIYQFNSGQPYQPYQSLLAEYGFQGSYCDYAFNSSTVGPGADSCRLIVSNPKAPLNSIAYYDQGGAYTGTQGYYEFGSLFNANSTGNISPIPVSPTSVRWLVNTTGQADLLGNPFPGSGRNILRGQSFNNLDANIYKNFAVNERIKVQLQLSAFNSLNRSYLGTPGAGIFDDNPYAAVNGFLSTAYNSSTNRTVQLGGKILF